MARPAWRKSAKNPDEPTNDFMVPKDPEKLVAWLENKRVTGKPQTSDQQQKLNLAYMLGQQYVVWDDQRRRWARPTSNPDDPNAPIRIPVNKIGGIVEHFIARLTKNAPEPQCRPVSDDDNDVGSAKAGTRILLHELHRLEWETVIVNLYFWIVPLAFAYLHPVWNPKGGKTAGTVEGEDVMEGEIELDIVPSFELSVDPNGLDMHRANWCVRTKTMTKEAVWEMWGVECEGSADAERSLSEDVYALVNATDARRDDASQNVRVHQMWMKPCRAAPKGMVITWTGMQVLEAAKPFPYKHGRLPFVQWDLLPGIGTREGRTWVTDLIPMQADYNDARSREAAIRRTLVPKLTYVNGSINPKALNSRVEAVGYNAIGERPIWDIPDSGWMSQYEASMARADQEMGERAGQTDSGSQPGSASMPAAAILALQEADDTKLAVSAKLLSRALAETGWQMLQLVRQYWTEDRLVRTWSEAGTLEVAQFSGSDVQNQLDIHVDAESALPRSKSGRVQLAMDLIAVAPPGLPGSPFNSWRDFFRLLDQPGTDFMTQSIDAQAKQACRENDDLLQGNVVEVQVWNNHQAHLTEHENERAGETYEAMARAAAAGDPEAVKAKAAYDGHCQAHYEMLLPAQASPTAGGTPQDPAAQQTVQAHDPAQQEYLDPLTGQPPDGVAVGAGQAPSALEGSTVGKRAGIGGPGQPGRVQGTTPDEQAASMGA